MTAGPEGSLRVLLLEDSLDDVELELYQLTRAGLKVEHRVARNRRDLLSALSSFQADIMLADYALPDITGLEAIELCRDKGVDIPVILITGEGNEMIAVDSLRHGAIDYLLKKNISGLAPRVSRALEIWKDRKAKRRAEEEERRLQRLLFDTQKMEAIGRLAGGIAHDFNNILTGIMGFADLCMKDVPLGSPALAKLQSIVTFSQKGADLVKQLLIFGRRMNLEFSEMDLNQFVRETVGFLKRIVEETIELRLDLGESLAWVVCDRAQFTQVLMNLILNARDAMDGRGTITIRTERCSPGEGLATFTDGVCLIVSDTGPGIDEENLEKIFDPFFTTKDLGKGTGLGLSIVYSVITSHGGQIKVESRKGGGTSFRIILPGVKPSVLNDASPFYRTLPQGAVSHSGGRETILIAEDEDVIRELLSTYLRSCGYTVATARDGEEALEIYRAGSHKIDLVVSDMRMPNMGGIDLFRLIRKISPSTRFVLMTGYSLVDEDEATLKSMDAVLAKPFVPGQAGELIRKVLDRKPA